MMKTYDFLMNKPDDKPKVEEKKEDAPAKEMSSEDLFQDFSGNIENK